MSRLRLFFDGGARPNPGAIEVAVVCRGRTFRRAAGHGDNNAAEWSALLYALDIAEAEGADDIELVGDSRLIVEQASARQPCRSAHLKPYHIAFAARAATFPRLRLRHVKRNRNLAGIALARDPVSFKED